MHYYPKISNAKNIFQVSILFLSSFEGAEKSSGAPKYFFAYVQNWLLNKKSKKNYQRGQEV